MVISRNVQVARDEIASILKRLEFETGQSVESIEIKKIEILMIGKSNPEFVIDVSILLNRPAGQGWLVSD